MTIPLLGALGGALFALALLPLGAAGQEAFPSRPIRIITSVPVGSAPDVAARVVADALSKELDGRVVVEPRPGADGQLARTYVREAPPDGHTLLLGQDYNLVILPQINETIANPLDELKLVSFAINYPLIMVAGAPSGIKTIKDLTERMQKTDEVTFSSSGESTPTYLACAYLAYLAKGKALHVPYRGVVLSLPDVMAGRVTYTVPSYIGAKGMIDSGQMIGLAVLADKRLPEAPTIPTIAEAGAPGMLDVDWRSWNALFAPQRTPPQIVEKLNLAIRKVHADPQLAAALKNAGVSAWEDMTQQQAEAVLQQQGKAWRTVLQRLDVKLVSR